MDGISAPHLYPKQMEVLKFLKQYVRKYQSMPKLKDIANVLFKKLQNFHLFPKLKVK
jgi:sulfur relay (sulfurtransferase) DsrC/TusE family protein